MEWNRMAWNGQHSMKRNGMRNGMEWMQWTEMEWNEWNGLRGMECKGVDWNGLDWNGMEWDGVFKIDVRSFQIGAPGPSKSVPGAPREIQIRFREHGE